VAQSRREPLFANAPGHSPAWKPRLASAALQGQDKIALRAPNRASYPSCDDDIPILRLALYPERAAIAE
jgi:hypothetical protein